MRQKCYDVFTFKELSPKAKDAVRQVEMEMGFAWADDYIASLKALAVHFNGKLSHYSVDFFANTFSDATFGMPEMEPDDIAAKLEALGTYSPETLKGHGDCKLTGFTGDEGAIDGFREAWLGGERDLNELMQAAFRSWLAAAQADCADQFTDEQLADHCDANEYEFFANGKMA